MNSAQLVLCFAEGLWSQSDGLVSLKAASARPTGHPVIAGSVAWRATQNRCGCRDMGLFFEWVLGSLVAEGEERRNRQCLRSRGGERFRGWHRPSCRCGSVGDESSLAKKERQSCSGSRSEEESEGGARARERDAERSLPGFPKIVLVMKR